MNKTERRQLIQALYDEQLPYEDIITQAAKQGEVTVGTVIKDLIEMFPDDAEAIIEAGANLNEPDPAANTAVKPKASKEAAKEVDQNYIHLIVEEIGFDSATGDAVSLPRPETVNVRSWPQYLANHSRVGITILEVVSQPDNTEAFKPGDLYKEDAEKARERVLQLHKNEIAALR